MKRLQYRLLFSSLLWSPILHAAGFPAPAIDLPPSTSHRIETAVFAGGCFWGVEAVFEHLRGVSSAVSGYTGGAKSTAVYELVGSGQRRGTPSRYGSSTIRCKSPMANCSRCFSRSRTIQRNWAAKGRTRARNIDRRFSTRRRSSAASWKLTSGSWTSDQILPRPIATEVKPLAGFYDAEEHHQHFVARNPNYGYVVNYDLPKLKLLQREFPQLWVGR